VASTAEVLRRLKKVGFKLVSHGKKHDLYEDPRTGRRITIPRHSKEIPVGTYHAILRDAGLD